jgi:DNA-directed RNA polymerase specialized sigma24 family protein
LGNAAISFERARERLRADRRSASEERLLELLAQDGASALDELLERYWHAVAAYVLRLTGSMDAAADVTQDTFCRLWERRSKWRIAGSVRGLLFQARHFFRARLAR